MPACRFYKFLISSAIDGQKVPGRLLRRHLGNCPSCRDWWHEQSTLAQRLSRGPSAGPQPPSPFLHGKIIAAVRREEAPRAEAPVPRWLGWPAGVLGTSLVLIFVAVQQKGAWRPPNQTGPLVTVETSSQGPASPVGDGLIANPAFVRLVSKLDEPLESELQSVVNDARNALNSLAYNFLPGKPAITD